MKIKNSLLVALTLFVATAQNSFAQATCTLNGESVPCSEMPVWIWIILGSIVVILIAAFIFWISMLIDAIKYQHENKMLWVLLIVFTNGLGAILYYFLAKRPRLHAMQDLANPSPQQPVSSVEKESSI